MPRPSAMAAAVIAALLLILPAGRPAAAGDLLVFAAASLQPALDPIMADWRASSGRGVKAAYAGTPILAKQIEQGAPADIFISADIDWMDHLAARGSLRASTRAERIGNRLVLIAPAASARAGVTMAPDLDLVSMLGSGRLAMGDPASVPAGRYAKLALESLGLWPSVAGRIAPVDNVRLALAYVARGEAPLGIVYLSDAKSEPAVRILAEFPRQSHPRIVYPSAILAASESPDARPFLDFLFSETSLKLFTQAGFDILPARAE